MIKEFVNAWDKNKSELEKHFRETKQEEYDTYKKIVQKLFELVVNPYIESDYDKFDIENIKAIDDGDYQGTQIFILHKKHYQPCIENYVYTNTYYGSCSGCDTLLSISNYSSGLPNEQQIKEYMDLALHLLQKCKMLESENNKN